MEAMGLLNPSSDSDIFCLQHVAFPMLSKTVEEFRSGWNHHIVSTEGMTPMQLFWSGLLRLRSEGGHHLEFTNQVFVFDLRLLAAVEMLSTYAQQDLLLPLKKLLSLKIHSMPIQLLLKT